MVLILPSELIKLALNCLRDLEPEGQRMGIRIDPTPPKGNWAGALTKALGALSEVLTQSYLQAGVSAYDAVKAFRVQNETLEQRTWTLWRESLALGLEDFFRTANLYRRPLDKEEVGRILKGILDTSAEIARSDSAELQAAHLSAPTDFPLYRALREQVPELADAVAPDHGQPTDALRRRLDRSYQRGFRAAWTGGRSHFDPLAEAFEGPIGEAVLRDEHWQRYYKALTSQVEEEPLFGQEKGGPTLAQVFVRLRAYWRAYLPKQFMADKQVKMTAHVCWLNDELTQWLDQEDKSDTLRIVTGGPGSGKSSSAKMFACEVARAAPYNIYYIPLHGLNVSSGVDSIVEAYVQTASVNPDSLPESPLAWLRSDYKPLLLIFDGLDEVARPDREGPEITRKFISNLRQWLSTVNGGGRSLAIKALTLGRPRAAEDAADEVTLTDRALLHVAPLAALGKETLARGNESAFEIVDPHGLCDIEQRSDYWERWTSVAPNSPKIPPAGLFEKSLNDLTIEPLLLYLLIYSGYLSEEWEEAAENRNRVYEAIFRRVHERDVKQKGLLLRKVSRRRRTFLR
jgi:hypothetical protein